MLNNTETNTEYISKWKHEYIYKVDGILNKIHRKGRPNLWRSKLKEKHQFILYFSFGLLLTCTNWGIFYIIIIILLLLLAMLR